MKFFKMRFRDEAVAEVAAVNLWEVRWRSRYGEYAHETKPEIEVFTSEDDANQFADALRDAFRLIKHTSGNEVYVKERPTNN